MNERNFAIGFIAITLMVVAVLGFSRLNFGNESANLANLNSPNNSILPESSSSATQSAVQQQKSSKKIYSQYPGDLPQSQLENKKAVIETTKGNIEFEIYPEATKAASNFIFLANDKFYDGLTFHRAEDWVIQGGDPNGNGTGGPGYKFPDEPVTKAYKRGIVAMANAGPNTNGSQFFILVKDTPLPPNYTIFGNVFSGLEVVDKIRVGDVMKRVLIQDLK